MSDRRAVILQHGGVTFEVIIHTEHAAQMLTRPVGLKVYRLGTPFRGAQGQTVTPRLCLVDRTCRYATEDAAFVEAMRILDGLAA